MREWFCEGFDLTAGFFELAFPFFYHSESRFFEFFCCFCGFSEKVFCLLPPHQVLLPIRMTFGAPVEDADGESVEALPSTNLSPPCPQPEWWIWMPLC